MSTTERLIQRHQLHMRRTDARPDTIRHRGDCLRRIHALLPNGLAEATAEELFEWQDRAREQLAPATVRVYTSHLKMFFRWATREEHIGRDPAVDLVTPRVARGRANPIDEDALRIAMACARDTTEWPMRTWLALAAYCGLRAGEIARLTRDSIGSDTLDIDGKGGRYRTVPLPAPIRTLLIAHVHGPGPIFRHRTGRALTPQDVTRDCSRHLHASGAGCSLHKLRHRYATRLFQLSKDPMLVKDLLGHSSLATTQVYLGVTAEHGRRWTDQLAKSLKRGNPRRVSVAPRAIPVDELGEVA